MRFLPYIVLALILFWWLRRYLRLRDQRGAPSAGTRPRSRRPERMIACSYCKVHVPESEGVYDDEHFFCCDEHRRLVEKR